MKQHITKDQLNELSEKERKALKSWYYPKKQLGDLVFYEYPITEPIKNEVVPFGVYAMQGDPTPLLSIGQMIEFLGDDKYLDALGASVDQYDGSGKTQGLDVEGICDSLWEAVKEILER